MKLSIFKFYFHVGDNIGGKQRTLKLRMLPPPNIDIGHLKDINSEREPARPKDSDVFSESFSQKLATLPAENHTENPNSGKQIKTYYFLHSKIVYVVSKLHVNNHIN